MFELDGKVALVTGGYSHLGRSLARGLAEAGATVIVGGRNERKFREVFETDEIMFEKLDIASTESIRKAFGRVSKKHGRIDILVNNAVYFDGNSPEKMNDQEWSAGVDGTLGSVFRCLREVIPYMKKTGSGSIINISSMYGMVSPDFRIYDDCPQFLNPPHYGAAKAGVIQLTKYYAVFLAKYSIRVNCLTPGPFPSKNVQKNKTFIKELAGKNPLGRIGRPDELKGPVVFLASNASSYVTGQNIVVDGGWTIW